jgi:hypothetical protein
MHVLISWSDLIMLVQSTIFFMKQEGSPLLIILQNNKGFYVQLSEYQNKKRKQGIPLRDVL